MQRKITDKKIIIDPEQWDIIRGFIASRVIPIQESQIGLDVINAVNSAIETKEKEETK